LFIVAVTFFPPRDAYRMWQHAPLLVFDPSDPLPRNDFVGPNPPAAFLTYYLGKPAKTAPCVEIVDANGRVIRHLNRLPNAAGLNRTGWDLSEDGPVKLADWPNSDQAPDEGPEALPSTYAVHLIVNGAPYAQPLAIRADPSRRGHDGALRAATCPPHEAQRRTLSDRPDDRRDPRWGRGLGAAKRERSRLIPRLGQTPAQANCPENHCAFRRALCRWNNDRALAEAHAFLR
jgi:hypothetical protein